MSEETLKRQIYNRILEDIINKNFPVDYILKEKELSERFGISKAPVREALIELSTEDIVKSIPRAGYRIVQLTEKDIFEATELRLILELPVLDTITNSADRATLHELRTQVEQFNYTKLHSKVPLDTWWNDNINFHVSLSAIAGNSLLTSTLETIIRRQWRAIAQLFWSGDPKHYLSFESTTHITLIKAIEKKNVSKAREILSEDILSIRNMFTYSPKRRITNL